MKVCSEGHELVAHGSFMCPACVEMNTAARLGNRIDWLQAEVAQLQVRNSELETENATLKEEVTDGLRYQEVEESAS